MFIRKQRRQQRCPSRPLMLLRLCFIYCFLSLPEHWLYVWELRPCLSPVSRRTKQPTQELQNDVSTRLCCASSSFSPLKKKNSLLMILQTKKGLYEELINPWQFYFPNLLVSYRCIYNAAKTVFSSYSRLQLSNHFLYFPTEYILCFFTVFLLESCYFRNIVYSPLIKRPADLYIVAFFCRNTKRDVLNNVPVTLFHQWQWMETEVYISDVIWWFVTEMKLYVHW